MVFNEDSTEALPTELAGAMEAAITTETPTTTLAAPTEMRWCPDTSAAASGGVYFC